MSLDWSAIYEETFPDLVRFLHRKVWDADRARELAQETFVRALREEPQNARAWLFTVAANLARDEARTVIRRRKHLALIRSEVQGDHTPAPDADLERRERLEAVRRALDELSERDRDALLLWDAGLGYDDIAAQTGLAVGAVGTTLARARRRLVEAHRKLEEKNAARG